MLSGDMEKLYPSAKTLVKECVASRLHAKDAMLYGFSDEAQELKRSAIAMTDNAALTSTKSDNAAGAFTTATHNVQNVASAAEQLAASIGEINRQIEASNHETQAASRQATETDELVRGLSATAA